METHQPPPVSPEEASAALRDAEQATATLNTTVPPWWYFVSLAVLVLVAPLLTVLPGTPVGIAVTLGGLVVWVVLLGVLVGTYIRHVGVAPRLRSVKPRQAVPLIVGAAVVMGAGELLGSSLDLAWAPFAAAAILAIAVLVLGRLVRRRTVAMCG